MLFLFEHATCPAAQLCVYELVDYWASLADGDKHHEDAIPM